MTPRLSRLTTNWVYGGTLAAVLLLILTPLLTRGWPLSETLTFLCLPAYMIHQYEEHDADRFRASIDGMLGIKDALSVAEVFWINILGVWGVMAAILWLTLALDPAWGVMAAWFLVINGAGHIAPALVLRRPNPGLWTALVLFLPLGTALIVSLHEATLLHHALSIAVILALHAAILLRVARKRRGPL